MWDLVEYLSRRQVSVLYHYHSTHFTVSFPRQDAPAAQRILDEWANAADVTKRSKSSPSSTAP